MKNYRMARLFLGNNGFMNVTQDDLIRHVNLRTRRQQFALASVLALVASGLLLMVSQFFLIALLASSVFAIASQILLSAGVTGNPDAKRAADLFRAEEARFRTLFGDSIWAILKHVKNCDRNYNCGPAYAVLFEQRVEMYRKWEKWLYQEKRAAMEEFDDRYDCGKNFFPLPKRETIEIAASLKVHGVVVDRIYEATA